MGKIYLFGIGGTGSRVLKALTMLMASGVKIDADAIVPIIIDPDHAAADLTRTVTLLRDYISVRKQLEFTSANPKGFFSTKIEETIPNFIMPLKETQNNKFKDYIGLENMTAADGNFDANYALATMLFSKENLESGMQVGFKGNPNIGSVVLNQFATSTEFSDFASSFKQGDRIFIISSIFGGTGASGFPLLLKNFRGIDSKFAGSALIKDAPIGAITVLPYFDVEPDPDSKIDSSTFVSKTKDALSYYQRNISGNKSLNALYYVADNLSKKYENSEGGVTQKNDAHFIELASALSIVDFANLPSDQVACANGVALNPIHKEFGIKNETESIIFGDFYDGTKKVLYKPLTQFVLFCKYMKEWMEESKSISWSQDYKIPTQFFSDSFYSNLTNVRDEFFLWLEEMGNNERSFKPFELSQPSSELFSLVKGVPPSKVMSFKSNYYLFEDTLNSLKNRLTKNTTPESRFVELFFESTAKLVERKLRIK